MRKLIRSIINMPHLISAANMADRIMEVFHNTVGFMERWADDASAFNRRISLPARMLLFIGSMVRRMKTFGCAAFLNIACLGNMNGEWMGRQ